MVHLARVRSYTRRGHAAGEHSRRDLVEALAGGLHYPAGYLDQLRDEWLPQWGSVVDTA